MNMVALSNRLASKVPHWHELEMIERWCGSWFGEQSAEDIIANINESIMSKSEPVKFG